MCNLKKINIKIKLRVNTKDQITVEIESLGFCLASPQILQMVIIDWSIK